MNAQKFVVLMLLAMLAVSGLAAAQQTCNGNKDGACAEGEDCAEDCDGTCAAGDAPFGIDCLHEFSLIMSPFGGYGKFNLFAVGEVSYLQTEPREDDGFQAWERVFPTVPVASTGGMSKAHLPNHVMTFNGDATSNYLHVVDLSTETVVVDRVVLRDESDQPLTDACQSVSYAPDLDIIFVTCGAGDDVYQYDGAVVFAAGVDATVDPIAHATDLATAAGQTIDDGAPGAYEPSTGKFAVVCDEDRACIFAVSPWAFESVGDLAGDSEPYTTLSYPQLAADAFLVSYGPYYSAVDYILTSACNFDGACDFGETCAEDCEGTCEPGDSLFGTDCDDICAAGEGGSIDCDGVCSLPEENEDGPDCDSLCRLTDDPYNGASCDGECDAGEAGTWDCSCDGNGVCDMGESPTPGGGFCNTECNGVCEPGDQAGPGISVLIQEDATIFGGDEFENRADALGDTLRVGLRSSEENEARALMRFDTSALAGTTVTRAQLLVMVIKRSGQSVGAEVFVYAVDNGWTAGPSLSEDGYGELAMDGDVTWLAKSKDLVDGDTLWTTPGGDIGTLLGSTIVGGTGAYIFDLDPATVEGMLGGDVSIILKVDAANARTYQAVHLASAEMFPITTLFINWSNDCDGVCEEDGSEDGSPDCVVCTGNNDGTCEAGEDCEADCDGRCQLLESGTNDCNGVCDGEDAEYSPDCDGVCGPADDRPSVDCNCDGDSVCEVGENGLGACVSDCDGTCGVDDDFESFDCHCDGDGECDTGETGGGECDDDCDGVCGEGDDEGSVDCPVCTNPTPLNTQTACENDGCHWCANTDTCVQTLGCAGGCSGTDACGNPCACEEVNFYCHTNTGTCQPCASATTCSTCAALSTTNACVWCEDADGNELGCMAGPTCVALPNAFPLPDSECIVGANNAGLNTNHDSWTQGGSDVTLVVTDESGDAVEVEMPGTFDGQVGGSSATGLLMVVRTVDSSLLSGQESGVRDPTDQETASSFSAEGPTYVTSDGTRTVIVDVFDPVTGEQLSGQTSSGYFITNCGLSPPVPGQVPVLFFWDDGASAWKSAADTCTPASVQYDFPVGGCIRTKVCHFSEFTVFFEDSGGSGVGDPHFEGFYGGSFEFMGEPDKVYSIFSDRELQFNARFVTLDGLDGTYIGEMGMRLGRTGYVKVSNVGKVTLPTTAVRDAARPQHYTLENGAHVFWNTSCCVVHYDAFKIHVTWYESGDVLGEAHGITGHSLGYKIYFDEAQLVREGRFPHGILGQTALVKRVVVAAPNAKQGEGVIEGHYSDYEITSGDLLGGHFVFDQFAPERD